MQPTDQPFNVNFTLEGKTQLAELADAMQCSKGRVIRLLVQQAHAMRIHHIPTCANGARCFVPQMHSAPPPPAYPAPVSTAPHAAPTTRDHVS